MKFNNGLDSYQAEMADCLIMVTDDSFLQTSGGVKANSLNTILDLNQIENNNNNYVEMIRHLSYYDKEQI